MYSGAQRGNQIHRPISEYACTKQTGETKEMGGEKIGLSISQNYVIVVPQGSYRVCNTGAFDLYFLTY